MFENIIGHKENIKLLERLIENNNLSHAYVFYGKEGIGKKLVAMEFAKKLLNTTNLETHPDYKYIEKLEDKKDLSVEQIREELNENIYEKPVASNNKIYIINDAQNLNLTAQNALLKTLEEPPSYVKIILISNNLSKFLPTILSRVNKISFEGVKLEELKEYINDKYNVLLSENVLKYMDGSIGLVSNLIENNKLDKLNVIEQLSIDILNKSEVNVFKKTKDIDFTDYILLDYLEYLMISNSKFEVIEVIEKAKQRLINNGNYDIVINTMILKILERIK